MPNYIDFQLDLQTIKLPINYDNRLKGSENIISCSDIHIDEFLHDEKAANDENKL